MQLASYFEWCLGSAPDNHREFHKLFIETGFDSKLHTIWATKRIWEVNSKKGHWNTRWPYLGFHSVSGVVSGWDASKEALLGKFGEPREPFGISTGAFSRTDGSYQDPAASLATDFVLEPGEKKEVVYLLGQTQFEDGKDPYDEAQKLIGLYGIPLSALNELDKVKQFWRELTGRLSVETGDDSFDLLVNIWLKYQTISGHLWARSGYYQQSGAYGFRDQLQASQIWLVLNPQLMLQQIRLHARHQFSDGTALHWWHALSDEGLAGGVTDDLLWLPFMTARYLNETADYSVLGDQVPYYVQGRGTLQEHCITAIEKVLSRFSGRGLPLIGSGDWCDGFNAVGINWRGESIWLGMFLHDVLSKWAAIQGACNK